MLNYGQFSFASPPRMGTTWFMQAAHLAGFQSTRVGKTGAHEPSTQGDSDHLWVVMARHPYTWLSSYYHALECGHVGVGVVDVFNPIGRQAKTFKEFVNAYLNTMPGQIGRMHDAYRASTVIRLEDLPWAAVDFFEPFEIGDDRIEAIKNQPACNTHPVVALRDDQLRLAVCRAESEYCGRYDYV